MIYWDVQAVVYNQWYIEMCKPLFITNVSRDVQAVVYNLWYIENTTGMPLHFQYTMHLIKQTILHTASRLHWN